MQTFELSVATLIVSSCDPGPGTPKYASVSAGVMRKPGVKPGTPNRFFGITSRNWPFTAAVKLTILLGVLTAPAVNAWKLAETTPFSVSLTCKGGKVVV